MISLNDRALAIVQRMLADAEPLQITAMRLDNGATVIDAGVNVVGSLEAGRLFAETCLGGLGRVDFCALDYGTFSLPGVTVTVNQPPLACMAAQYAGWALKVTGAAPQDTYMAMGSGPARALYRGEPLFRMLQHHEEAEAAVLSLENRSLPSASVAAWIAEKCGVAPDRLYLLVAPTASIVGSVQIAARVVETGMHKMAEVGFDLGTVLSGFGTCPLAPIAGDDLRAIGRTNDGVLYGGKVWYSVRGEDHEIEERLAKLPSSASRDYGTPFYELFQRYQGDFYKIDPSLFSPAEVFLNNVVSGRTFHAGRVNSDILRRMWTE